MSELILHLLGDYVTQSDWMANEKTKRAIPALAHAVVYSLPFLLLGPSLLAFAVILGTHFVIDRYRLARYVCFAKNALAPATVDWCDYCFSDDGLVRVEIACGSCRRVRMKPWAVSAATGYDPARPAWLAVWLMIAADNTLHLAINHLALRYL